MDYCQGVIGAIDCIYTYDPYIRLQSPGGALAETSRNWNSSQ